MEGGEEEGSERQGAAAATTSQVRLGFRTKPTASSMCSSFPQSGNQPAPPQPPPLTDLYPNPPIPWRRKWQPTPVSLPGKSYGQRSLVGCSPWGRKESDTTERLPFTFHFHALEREMATHSSVLAWRIPGTGEPGGLPSLGSDTGLDMPEAT